MDPFSALFSVYFDSLATPIHHKMTDMLGTEIQAQVVEYREVSLDYQYQLWRIRNESVCSGQKSNIGQFSRCTEIAKSFFTETCLTLQNNPQQHWRYTKLKNMYCQAASSYQPVIAKISRPPARESELMDAKQKCSLLTLDAMSGSAKALEAKNKACADYQKMLSN
jgi:hypothetical protein